MDETKYLHAQNKAWQVLIDAGVKTLPVSMTAICNHLKIKLVETDDIKGGYTTVVNQPYIVVDSRLPAQRKRYTIAHEIGHNVLGHLEDNDTHDQEESANIFALALLAPGCILRSININSVDEIMQICNISEAAARHRWIMLKNHLRYYISPLAEELEEQFADFIKTHS